MSLALEERDLMNTWICRVLAIVFFMNTLPVDVCAQYMPRKLDQKALERQIGQKSVEELRNQEKVELERELKSKDLSPRERKFIELELEIVNTEIECLERQCNANIHVINQLPGVYAPRLEDLYAREEVLEKEEALNDFYQQAQSLPWIGAAVAAMHAYAENSKKLADKQDREFANAKAGLDVSSGNLLRTVQTNLSVPGMFDTEFSLANMPKSIDVLKLWEDNEITMEDLIEYIDPIGQPFTGGTLDSAKLLFAIFFSYNSTTAQLDKETKEDALWVAKRLKWRVTHELQRIKGSAELRANLMLLLLQVNKFLNTYNKETDAQIEEDRTMAGYDMITKELNSGRDLYQTWNVGDVYKDLVAQVKQGIAKKPNQDSIEFEQLRRDLSTLVTYAMVEGGDLHNIVVEFNKDGKEYHGYYEPFVTEFFSSLYDVLVNFPMDYNKQQFVRDLLLALAGPKYTYNGKTYKNAVNVRVQALSVASVLREAADTHAPYSIQDILGRKTPQVIQIPHLVAGLFTDLPFRQTMAGYTIDIYAPTTTWNAAAMGFKDNKIERYGLTIGRTRETDEVTQLSDHLASLFASFLPVKEPTSVWTKQETGMYRGCSIRSVGPVKELSYLAMEQANLHSVRQSHAVDEDDKPTNIECPEGIYGNPSTILVVDSEGIVRSILKGGVNLSHASRADQDIAESILWEVLTWYLWGAAFKALGWAWKAGKAAIIATRSIAKGTVASGMKAARWQSKFSQVWKYSTKGWQNEAGIVNKVTRQGENYLVELARPGFKSMTVRVPAKGISLRTLKGRVAFRRALRRELEGASKGATKAGNSTAAKAIDEFRAPLSKAEQKMVKNEQPLVKAVKGELKNGGSFEVVSGNSGVKLYRPTGGNPYVDPLTALPEKHVLERATGNLYGKVSGEYAGTTVSAETETNAVAYDIATGLARSGNRAGMTLSPSFTGRYLWNKYPIMSEGWGWTKMVATFRITDPLVYQLYLKPWQERVAKEQNAYLAQKHGVDQNELDETPTATNALERAQTLGVEEPDIFYASRFATISGTFVGLNNALNVVLPQWLINARRGLFNWTTSVSSFIDAPFERFLPKSVTELAPTPGAAIMMYPMLAGDPTPDPQQNGTAADEQYRQVAQNQRLQRAMDGHDVKVYQNALAKDIQSMQNSLEQNLKEGTEIAAFLSALPNGKREMKTAYQVYIQKLKEASQLAQTDIAKAQQLEEDTSKTFIHTQADIMKRAIHAYVAKEKAETIANQIGLFNKNYNISPSEEDEDEDETPVAVGKAKSHFVSKHRNALKDIFNEYYSKQEQYLIDFYTALSTSIKTHQDVDVLEKTAQRNLEQLEKDCEFKIRQLENSLSMETLTRRFDTEIATINGDENTAGSLKEFLNDSYNSALLQTLPDGERRTKQVYKTYEQALKEAKKLVKQSPEKAEQAYQDAAEKLVNTRTDILCEGVAAYAHQNREKQLQAEDEYMTALYGIFFTPEDKTQLAKLINNYWNSWEQVGTRLYRTLANAILNPENEEAAEEVQVVSSQMDQLNNDIETGIENLKKKVQDRLHQYGQQRQAAH